jgi:hypothetical protein
MASHIAETALVRAKLLLALQSVADANGISLTDGVVVPEHVDNADYLHPNYGPALFAANLVLAAVTVVVVLARVWARIFVAGGIGDDDVMTGAAMVVVLGSTAHSCFGARKAGIGKHFYDLTLDEVTRLLKVGTSFALCRNSGADST